MAIISEVLTTIKKDGGKWAFTGQLIDDKKIIPVLGTVGDYPTESQIKRAILEKLETIKTYYEKQKVQITTKTLAADKVFKPILTISAAAMGPD